MEAEEARALSPLFLTPKSPAPMTVVLGGDESDEFHRQAQTLADTWGKYGITADVLAVPGRDHFTVLNALAEPGHKVVGAAKKLLGL